MTSPGVALNKVEAIAEFVEVSVEISLVCVAFTDALGSFA